MNPSSSRIGQQLGDDLAPGELDPGLGVGDVQAEQQPRELLVAPGVEAPQRRVDDHGLGMPLAPDGEVRGARLDAVDELAQHRGRDVPVTVDEPEIAPPAEAEAEPREHGPCPG